MITSYLPEDFCLFILVWNGFCFLLQKKKNLKQIFSTFPMWNLLNNSRVYNWYSYYHGFITINTIALSPPIEGSWNGLTKDSLVYSSFSLPPVWEKESINNGNNNKSKTLKQRKTTRITLNFDMKKLVSQQLFFSFFRSFFFLSDYIAAS